MAVAMLFLLTLVPSSAACPQAILLRAEHDRTSVLLSWDILPGSVDADAWVVEKSVDGLEPEGIVLAGTATGYADETNDAAFGTAYAVYYLLDGRRSQPSNSVIVLVYPRCDVISGPNVHPDCLFPLPP